MGRAPERVEVLHYLTVRGSAAVLDGLSYENSGNGMKFLHDVLKENSGIKV